MHVIRKHQIWLRVWISQHSQVAIYIYAIYIYIQFCHKESESEVEKCNFVEPGVKQMKNYPRNSRV